MYNPKTLREAQTLRVIDDALFSLVAGQEGVCQEILRTLLDDDKLVVHSVKVQDKQVSLYREVILDALCTTSDGTICNIEMQKGDRNNDLKRVRFHASLITSTKTPKGTLFDNIPNVKVLYITEYDALGNGQAVTHVSRCQLKGKTYHPVNDGEDIIFANASCKQRNKYTHLLKLFLRSDSFYDEAYPELSKAVKHFKDSEEGRSKMCKSIELYATSIATDTCIKECAFFNYPVEKTIVHVLQEFPQTTEEYIKEKYEEYKAAQK